VPADVVSDFQKHRMSRRAFVGGSSLLLSLQAASIRRFPLELLADGASINGLQGCTSPVRDVYPPQLQSIIAKLDPTKDAFPSEIYVAEIEAILLTWSFALCNSVADLEVIGASLLDVLEGSSFQPAQIIPLRRKGSIRTEKRIFSVPREINRTNFLAGLRQYLSVLKKLEICELEIFGARIAQKTPLQLETEIRVDLVGVTIEGREEWVGTWAIDWLCEEGGRWKIQKWSTNPEMRSRLSGRAFSDVTDECFSLPEPGMQQLLHGIDDWRTLMDAGTGIDVYGNHGIAVGDIDGSGFESIYVCQPSGLPNRLYKNRGDGTFEDISEKSGADILDGTASALFVDFQNRGRQDLLVVRTSGPLLLENQGNARFEPRPNAFRFARAPEGTFTSAAAADYNRDGLVDVYFCVYSFYQGLSQYQFPTPYYDAKNGPPNFLFRNRGDGTFEDVTAASGLNQNNDRFSFAAAWCDFDDSGFPSIYVANDFGQKNFYHNNGDGTFRDIAKELGVEDYGPGMSVCWLDYDGDGRQDLYVANMWLKEGKRITGNELFLPGAPKEIRALYQKHNAGNSLYRNLGGDGFANKTSQWAAAMGRWSWSCASWDADNQGCADLYVANGFVSGPNTHDLQSFFWRQVAQRSYESGNSGGQYELGWNAVNELVRCDYSWSGYERNVFYASNFDGTFAEVSGLLGLDFIDDSRAFALADFDHDGLLEFALKNRTGPQLRLIRNDLAQRGNSVTFKLSGRVGNRDAIGATVTLQSGDQRQTKFVSAGSGFASQHTKELCFGLGDIRKNVSITIKWPTGDTQRVQNVPINCRVEIVEGQSEFKSTVYAPTRKRKPGTQRVHPGDSLPTTFATWLVAPLYGPAIRLKDTRGVEHDLGERKGMPACLTLLRAGCDQIEEQLKGLKASQQLLAAGGISCFAAVLGSDQDIAALQLHAQESALEFPVLLLDNRTFGAWNIQFRYLFDRRHNISFPTTLLFDGTGGVIRIYQGSTKPNTILQDSRAVAEDPGLQSRRAMPLPGKYFGNEMKHNYFTYGVAFVEYGYPDAAEAAFRRVVQNDPNYAAGWFNLGTVYLNEKRFPEARKCLLEAVRLNPKDVDGWNNLGMVSGSEEKYEEALSQFQKAANLNPDYMVAIQNMVRIYEFQRRPADAQKILQELVDRSPRNAELRQGLAMSLVAQNKNDQAREQLEIAVQIQPDSADIRNNLGVVLMRLGEMEAAVRRFKECQRLAPDFDRPYLNLAHIFEKSGDVSAAQSELKNFLARNPTNDQARAALEKLGTQ
jgi:tetratricopeptide (TPR) repeat protein